MSTILFGDVKTNATNVTMYILLLKISDNTRLTGLVAANLTAAFMRDGLSAPTVITLSDLASLDSPYSSGGIKEISSTLMPGWYRFDSPAAMWASGSNSVGLCIMDGATGQYDERFALELKGSSDNADNVGVAGAGLSALPAVALNAAGMDAVVVETGINARQALAEVMAACLGILSGVTTNTITGKNPAGNATRFTITVDSNDNRTNSTLNPPA
jgi:hypothetical protein